MPSNSVTMNYNDTNTTPDKHSLLRPWDCPENTGYIGSNEVYFSYADST